MRTLNELYLSSWCVKNTFRDVHFEPWLLQLQVGAFWMRRRKKSTGKSDNNPNSSPKLAPEKQQWLS